MCDEVLENELTAILLFKLFLSYTTYIHTRILYLFSCMDIKIKNILTIIYICIPYSTIRIVIISRIFDHMNISQHKLG